MVEIKIIGTSHISKQSVSEIKKVIGEFKPDIVAIELDAQRYVSLMNQKRRRINLKTASKLGFFGFIFYLIGSMSQKILGNRYENRNLRSKKYWCQARIN